MYRVTPFYKKFCQVWKKYLGVYDDDCDVYSIWRMYPKPTLLSILEFFTQGCQCHTQWFPLIYWTVFIVSVLGFFRSASEFIFIVLFNQRHVTMWRKRKYYVLPCWFVRKCRIVGSLIMLNSWAFLLYALVYVSPYYLWPWLFLNMTCLIFELIVWITELVYGIVPLDVRTIISFLIPTFNCYLVCCVYKIFQRAIDLHETAELHLWSK